MIEFTIHEKLTIFTSLEYHLGFQNPDVAKIILLTRLNPSKICPDENILRLLFQHRSILIKEENFLVDL